MIADLQNCLLLILRINLFQRVQLDIRQKLLLGLVLSLAVFVVVTVETWPETGLYVGTGVPCLLTAVA